MRRRKLAIGDRIKFRAVTRHSDRPAWRKVVGFDLCDGRPLVRFHGWDNFIVRWDEIQEIEKATA